VVTHRLAVRLDSLGDVLVTGPAIRALRATCDRLTLLCGPRGEAAARLLPGVDEVICWRAPWIDPQPDPVDAAHLALLHDLVAATEADEAVIFTSFHQSPLPTALVLRSAGVRWVGAVSHDYPGSLLDLRLSPPDPMPEPLAQLRLALACGGRLPPGDDGRLAVTGPRRGRAPSPYVVLHPGTSVPARAWPVGRYAELAAELEERRVRVVVTGAPAERPLTAAVAAAAPGAVDLGGRTDLKRLGEVLRDAAVVVAGNTGPAHLAAAVGTPVVSLFAPTVPALSWAPYGVPSVVLGDQRAACAGTRATTCPVAGHPCLASVSAETVADAVGTLAPHVVRDRPEEGVAS
jgi:ADP-heptose:LPS heptosyltransferase